MKLKIQESRFDRYPDSIKQVKAYIRKIASLDPNVTTYEDLMSLDWSGMRMIEDEIRRCESKGLSVEDCIDSVIEDLRYWVKWMNDEMKKSSEYKDKIDRVYSVLDTFLQSNYKVQNKIDSSEGYFWTIIPPKNADHDDCIAFVDSVVDAVNGHYNTTGRGGSWSRWNIICDDGVRLSAGWLGRTYWSVQLDSYK